MTVVNVGAFVDNVFITLVANVVSFSGYVLVSYFASILVFASFYRFEWSGCGFFRDCLGFR